MITSLIIISIYFLFYFLKKRYKFINPMITTSLVLIIIYALFDLSLVDFRKDTSVLSFMLTPITMLLGMKVYENKEILKKYYKVIILSTLVGSIVGIVSVYILAKAFNLNEVLVNSLLVKSVTSAVGLEVSQLIGGNPSISVTSIIVTGIIGSNLASLIFKKTKKPNKVSHGLGLGAASHVFGTSKALEHDNMIAGIASISLSLTAIFSAIILLLFF